MSACFRAIKADLVRATDKSPAAAREADADLDLALDFPKRAFAAGFKNVAQMKTDDDLNPLRKREDFKKLLGSSEPAKSTAATKL